MNDKYFLSVVEQVPADQLNAWIIRHGFKPIPKDDPKVTKSIVAAVLKAIVDQHGQSAAFELEDLRTQANDTKKALSEVANPNMDLTKNECKCTGNNCPCKSNGDGTTPSIPVPASPGTVEKSAPFSFSKFVTDNSKLIIVGTVILAGIALWRIGHAQNVRVIHSPSHH